MNLFRFALRNLAGNAFRSWVVAICAFLVVSFVLASVMILRGAEKSLRLVNDRLGADIIVVPSGTQSKIETALLMGHPTSAWMPAVTLPSCSAGRWTGGRSWSCWEHPSWKGLYHRQSGRSPVGNTCISPARLFAARVTWWRVSRQRYGASGGQTATRPRSGWQLTWGSSCRVAFVHYKDRIALEVEEFRGYTRSVTVREREERKAAKLRSRGWRVLRLREREDKKWELIGTYPTSMRAIALRKILGSLATF